MNFLKKITSVLLICFLIMPSFVLIYGSGEMDETRILENEDLYRDNETFSIRPIDKDEIPEDAVIINTDELSGITPAAGEYNIYPSRKTINQGDKLYIEADYIYSNGGGWTSMGWSRQLTNLNNEIVEGWGIDVIDWDMPKGEYAYYEAIFYAPGDWEVWLHINRDDQSQSTLTSKVALITVREVTAKPSITSYKTAMTVGDSYTFKHNIYYGFYTTHRGEHLNDYAAYWSSSNTSVATVDELNGIVTAVAPGTTTITAESRCGNYKLSKTVTVTAKQVDATSISVSAPGSTLDVGNTMTVTGTVNPSNATNKNITWTSSDTTKATVNTSGRVTAIAPGSVKITGATHNNKTSSVTLTIQQPAQNITVSPAQVQLSTGQTKQLEASISPSNTTDQSIVWTSSNPSVAVVNGTGLVTALDSGTAEITAKSHNGLTAVSTVTVEAPIVIPVESISINMPEKIIVGREYDLVYTVYPANASLEGIIAMSSNPTVLKVENGKVIGLKEGSATLVLTAPGNVMETAVINVVNTIAVEDVEIVLYDTKFEAGQTYRFDYHILPSDATNQNVSIMSSNPNVVQYLGNNQFKAIQPGQSMLTIIPADNPAKAKAVMITVSEAYVKLEGINVSAEDVYRSISVGDSFKINVEFTPENATNKNLTYKDLGGGNITVDNQGNVTANSVGYSAIMIIAEDGGYITFCNVDVVNTSKESFSDNNNQFDIHLEAGEVKELPKLAEGLTWLSSNPQAVTVQGNYMEAVGNGKAIIVLLDENGAVIESYTVMIN